MEVFSAMWDILKDLEAFSIYIFKEVVAFVSRQLSRFAPRHESSYHSGSQSYIVSFVHLFLTLLFVLLFPMLSKHPERLTDSYQRYL
jgi:hypothetical protein